MSLMVGQVVDREVYLAGFDLNDDSTKNAFGLNGTGETNTTAVNLKITALNMECGKECYAISIATALTLLAGVYQVRTYSGKV